MSDIASSSNVLLEIDNLQVMYTAHDRKVFALQDASLIVREGEAVAIAGESGSGKSTLARAAMGLLPRTAARITKGRITVTGQNVTHYTGEQWQSLRGNPVAMVFQDPLSYLNPVVRVGHQIEESIKQHDPEAVPKKRALELLDLVKLRADVLRRYPHELSGGMRQRVLLAIALGCRPRLLIADEPTTALDVTTQGEILSLLTDLRKSLNMSLLIITHDLGVVRWNCDRVYIMYAGHTVEKGTAAEVLNNPQHPYTKGLIAASRLERQADGYLSTIGGDVPRLDQVFTHCPFVSRCEMSMAICRETMPNFAEVSTPRHDARCWLLENRAEPRELTNADT
jgi:oligopeptide/dipeptide ABC transporter ATP-binding protein